MAHALVRAASPLLATPVFRAKAGARTWPPAEHQLSIRLDASRLLVTPSGRRKDELEPDDLVVIRTDHETEEARSRSGFRPTSDLAIHLAIHAARPDIAAVAHAHLPSAMALTVADEVPDPAVLPETSVFIPRLPYLTLGVPGSRELADRTPRRPLVL